MGSTTNDIERELWRPEVQGAPVAAATRAGIAGQWKRVWEQPIDYYRDRYTEAGLDAHHVPEFDDIPRTNKADLRRNDGEHPPFGTYRGLALDAALRIGSSTGTTGTPTLIFYGERDLEAHIEAGDRNLWRYGMRAGGRFTHSWPQGLYPTSVSGGTTYLRAGLLEISVGPPFSPEVALDHLRMWQLLQPTGFMMTSSQLALYEGVAAKERIDFGAMLEGSKIAFLEARCQFAGPRQRLEETYGFRLHNIGGASEIPGFSVSDCRFHNGLHARGDMIHLQACDPRTGREVPDGERGSLVVSSFGSEAFFLRYDLEDIVTVTHGVCKCGEIGPRYTLLGRQADSVEVDGKVLLPLDVQLAAFDDHPDDEFQVVPHDSGGVLRLRVEGNEANASAFADAVASRLEVPVEAGAVEVGSLPRSSFKPRRVQR